MSSDGNDLTSKPPALDPAETARLHGKPATTSAQKLEVMTVAEEVADATEKLVVLVDNAIWMLGAKGGCASRIQS